MIRYSLKTDVSALSNLERQLDQLARDLARIGNEVIEAIKPGLLKDLRQEPPERSYPDDYPIEWESELQQRAFFASNGFGAGIPTGRSGKLTNSWTVTGVVKGLQFLIVIENTQSHAKFVVGSLARNVQQAARFQQRFHKITGWKLATEPVQKWLAIAQDLFESKWLAHLATLDGFAVKGRAFTNRTRRRRG